MRVEFIDPQEHPELEQEANEKYGIRPVPFQFASKYRASVEAVLGEVRKTGDLENTKTVLAELDRQGEAADYLGVATALVPELVALLGHARGGVPEPERHGRGR